MEVSTYIIGVDKRTKGQKVLCIPLHLMLLCPSVVKNFSAYRAQKIEWQEPHFLLIAQKYVICAYQNVMFC